MSLYKKILIALCLPYYAYGAEMVPRFDDRQLPEPLSRLDEHLYATSFELQQNQHLEAAIFVKNGIENDIARSWLDYHEIMQNKENPPSFEVLSQFLENYPDHPKRKEIHDMAEKAKGRDDELAEIKKRKPFEHKAKRIRQPTPMPKAPARNAEEQRQANRLNQVIRTAIRSGDINQAQFVLVSQEASDIFSTYEIDEHLTKVARLYFNEGQDREALAILNEVTGRNGDYLAEAWWIAGLASWRMKDYQKAKKFFEEITKRPKLPLDYILAAEFWLSRCSLALAEYDEWYKPLFSLAQYNNEYYGILAAETLGKLFTYDEKLRKNKLENLLTKEDEGRRFTALMQLGHEEWAKEELEELLLYSPFQDQLVLSWLASELGWFDLAHRESEKLSRYNVNASLGLPRMQKGWVPKQGMYVDEALTLAIIRQESQFNSQARSSAGAQGLMQVTRQTKEETVKIYNDNVQYDLLDPQDNIYIGQRYIKYLLSDNQFNQNLFLSLAAWNAGPSKARRWVDEPWRYAEEDPLFWVESLPVSETRLFIKKVSRNLWLYRQRLGQQSFTLTSLISGDKPIYKDIDPEQDALKKEKYKQEF